MQVQGHEPTQQPKVALSPSIYAALVHSLFQNYMASFAGTVCAAIAAVMTAWKTGNVMLWPCALFIIAVGAVRSFDMHVYEQRRSPLTPESAAEWERRYRVGAVLYASALGLWCLVGVLGTDDPVAHLLCLSVTIGYIAAGTGRNYGRPLIAQAQVIYACVPMCLALFLRGDLYYMGLALLNALFFVALKRITLDLHQVYVKALVASEEVASIAHQFDIALNNMPHGLCMFDANGTLAVINHSFTKLLGVPGDMVNRGLTARDVVNACVNASTVPPENADAIVGEIRGGCAGDLTTLTLDLAGERALSWTFQPMAGGGSVVLVEDITERRNAEARINHMARFDELTGLPNRVSFRDELEKDLTLRADADRTSALLFIDLDQFKQVNDTLGHPCGDRLLCMVADRLRSILRQKDFVGRFGGDEFVVFQRNVHSNEEIAALAREIVQCLSERYEIDHHLVEIGASIGIATTTSQQISADNLLKYADMALYRAKADGRGTFCFFHEEMAQSVEARRILEFDLRNALVNEEFELFYQPLVNLKTGRVSTCEALLRWTHPVRGAVSPADIIPVAEEMGLIVDLGRWILRKACMECMKWPQAVRIAVNLSPLQFHQRDILNDVRYALEVSGLPAERLELEITESSLMRNTPWTREALAALRREGVSISLDDFGTGYSSLSYLHNFPLQKVKIDRSFLEGIGDDRPLTLLRGVARLSADLGMSVVVEGIETNEQLDLVTAEGTVTEVQGYLFSRPVPAAQLRQLLAASHGRPSRGKFELPSRSIA
jgi:diguanylate cyclase (GGDEF)-like protein